MRPWRIRDGYRLILSSDYKLQCGHGHETVENGDEFNEDREASMLQCGHGHETVENTMRE